MKKFFVIALVGFLCLPTSAQSQKKAAKAAPKEVKAAKIVSAQPANTVVANADSEISYTVSGTCAADVKMVHIVSALNPRDKEASINVTDGKFTYSGKAPRNAFMGIGIDKQTLMFIVDGTPIVMNLVDRTLKGSPLNEKLNAYTQQMNALQKSAQAAVEPYMQAQREGKTEKELQAMMPAIDAELNPIQEKMTALVKQIVKENPDNVIPAPFIHDAMYEYELSELKELISDKYAYSSHPLLDRVKKYVAAEEKKQAIVGQQFIDIEENDPEGTPHKLSEYVGKGNYVLIDFWASWCGPCMQEMPNVKANFEKYKAKGFNVVGLSFDRAKEPWVKAIKEKELNWVHLSDLKFWQTIAASTYGINSIPSSLLVDPTGKVIARDLRGDALGKKLAKIYGE